MQEEQDDRELGVFLLTPTRIPMDIPGQARARAIGHSCNSPNLRTLFGREMFPTAVFVQSGKDYRRMIREVLIGMEQPIAMAIEFIPGISVGPQEIGTTMAGAVLDFAQRNPNARSVAMCASPEVTSVILDCFCADMGDSPSLLRHDEFIVMQLFVSHEMGDAIAGNVVRFQPYIRPM